eukprot:1158661-Pelagomonas_calceolata.AAC.8
MGCWQSWSSVKAAAWVARDWSPTSASKEGGIGVCSRNAQQKATTRATNRKTENQGCDQDNVYMVALSCSRQGS